MDNKDTGLLLNSNNIKLHRQWFKEMTKLLGIQVIYRASRPDKHYDGYGELDSFYYNPEVVGCIFDEHPTQRTMRKLGWDSELSESNSLIYVPYDLKDLQQGSLFIIPSGLDNSQGRVFKVVKMFTTSIYPASIACEIGPVWENAFDNSLLLYNSTNFNLLADDEGNEDEEKGIVGKWDH